MHLNNSVAKVDAVRVRPTTPTYNRRGWFASSELVVPKRTPGDYQTTGPLGARCAPPIESDPWQYHEEVGPYIVASPDPHEQGVSNTRKGLCIITCLVRDGAPGPQT